MMTHHAARHAVKLVNKRTLRLLAFLGTVMAVCTAVMSALGALLLVRQLQLVSAQRRALPVLQEAAQLYLEKNAPERRSPASRKKKSLRPEPWEESPEE